MPPRVPLHEIALSALLDHLDATREMSETWAAHVRDGWRDLEVAAESLSLLARASEAGVPGYLVAVHGHGSSGIVCLFEAVSGRPVGGIYDGNLHVYPEHRGKGLAVETMILAFASGIKDASDPVMLSPGGRAVRRSAHRGAVSRALADGICVPSEALADHPDLDRVYVLVTQAA